MKKQIDIKFYNSLDEDIKKYLSLKDFLLLERKNKFNCDFYKKLIDNINKKYNYDNEFDKIINFIQILDLDPEKIGENIKDCDFAKKIKDYYDKNIK